MNGSYYSNPIVRRKIDALLQMNACVQANLGTRSKFDMGSRETAEELWWQFLVEIRSLDPEFYQSVASSEEKEMVTRKIYNKRRFREATADTV